MNRSPRISGHAVFVILLISCLWLGWAWPLQLLYDLHLWPHPGPDQVVAYLKSHAPPDDSFRCEPGTGGWEFVCYAERRPRVLPKIGTVGTARQEKYGVWSNVFTPVVAMHNLPLDQPTPSREDYLRARSNGRTGP